MQTLAKQYDRRNRFVTTTLRSKAAISIAIGAIAACSAFAAHAAVVKKPIDIIVDGTVHQTLFAIGFEGQQGVAVGAAGEVQTTEDGGKTWKVSKLPTDLAMLGVHIDATRTIAVGQTGKAFVKSAGGDWESVDTGTDSRLFSVSSNVGGLAVAAGEFGTLLLSEDGGRTWHKLTLDWMQVGTDGGAEPHLYGAYVAADGTMTVVGEFGLVLRSTDRGRSWAVASKGIPSLFSVKIRDDGVGFAVGQDGYALKTTDAGATWTCIDVGSKAILNGVHSSPDGRVTVTGMREMVVSSDDGATWDWVDNEEVTTVWYVGVASPGNEVLAVGQSGRIIRIGS